VQLGTLLFDDSACNARFGKPQSVTARDRAALAACLEPAWRYAIEWESGTRVPVVGIHDWLYQVDVRDQHIVAIGLLPADPVVLPVIDLDKIGFRASKPLQQTIARMSADALSIAVFERCHDLTGAVERQRVVRTSGLQEFDEAVLSYLATTPHSANRRRHGPHCPR
jgi:hypothetical protein